jgi:hypothetical protein
MDTLMTPVALLAALLDAFNNQSQHLGGTVLDQPAVGVALLLEVLNNPTDRGVALK